MRIGIDARMYGAAQTGIGTYIKHLIKNLAVIDKKNEYILFMRPTYFGSFELPAGNFKKVKSPSRWYSWGEQSRFLFDVLRQNCDLVHFPHFSHPIFYPRKFVVTIHDLTPLHFPGRRTARFRRWAYGKVLHSASFSSEKIIVPSFYTKKDLTKKVGVRSSKVEVISEGVRYRSRIGRSLKNYGSQKQKVFRKLRKKYPHLRYPFIFYTGVWRYHKNVGGLLEAYIILKHNYDFEGQLVLGGGRKESDVRRIKAKIDKLGLGDKVFTPGFLSQKDLRHFYQAARVFVLPSKYEGFGLGALEALSQGTPVCASRIGPLPEILGKAGLYFNPESPEAIASCINKVLNSETLVARVLKEGSKQLDKFSWLKMAKITLQVYEQKLDW